MTKIKTMLVALLIGSSSFATIAAAQPSGRVDRDHAEHADRAQGNRGWAALSSTVAASGDRQFTDLNGTRTSAIRFQLQRGRVYVQQIAVELENGRTQVQQVGRWMSARGDASETIELGARQQVKRVIVYTSSGDRAAYQLLGE